MAKIKTNKNGPYIVENLETLENSKGKPIPKGGFVALCRCGKSSTKPFCDGTHIKINFTDEKADDRVPDKMDDYVGKNITIHDNRGVCAHRGHCTTLSPNVFRIDWAKEGKDRWIDPDGEDVEKIIKTINICPSGALSYTKDGVLHKNLNHKSKIIVSKDGPYDIEGELEYEDDDGNKPESKEHYTLCRCGASKNKPFCNGQHWHIKFRDDKND